LKELDSASYITSHYTFGKTSRSCETLDCACPATQRYNPEEFILQHYRCENLKYYRIIFLRVTNVEILILLIIMCRILSCNKHKQTVPTLTFWSIFLYLE